MKFKSKEVSNGKTIITTIEPKFIFWEKERKFEAQREIVSGYWSWLELPDYKLVYDNLSFQLDKWNKVMADKD